MPLLFHRSQHARAKQRVAVTSPRPAASCCAMGPAKAARKLQASCLSEAAGGCASPAPRRAPAQAATPAVQLCSGCRELLLDVASDVRLAHLCMVSKCLRGEANGAKEAGHFTESPLQLLAGMCVLCKRLRSQHWRRHARSRQPHGNSRSVAPGIHGSSSSMAAAARKQRRRKQTARLLRKVVHHHLAVRPLLLLGLDIPV